MNFLTEIPNLKVNQILLKNKQVAIPSYHESTVDRKIIFYDIYVEKPGSTQWTVEKRYSEFDDFQKILQSICQDIPKLPGKTFFKISQPEQLEKRRIELEKFLQTIILRSDVFNSEPCKAFLQIDFHAPEFAVTPPKFICESSYSLGLRDFHYQEDQGIIITLVSEMNIVTRVDSLLTNLKFPWETSEKDFIATVGALEFYVLNQNQQYQFEILWAKTFSSQAICLYWDQPTGLLAVGLDDGSLYIEKVYCGSDYNKHEMELAQKVHSARIMGVAIDNIKDICYTISEDKSFKSTEIRKGNTLSSISVSATKLTVLIYDKENQRVFIANKANDIYIYEVMQNTPVLVHQLFTQQQKIDIRALHYDEIKNYIFVGGYENGSITVFDIAKPGKEKLAKCIMGLSGKAKIRVIRWSNSRFEIFAGHEDGTITFWNAKKAKPIYVLRAHDDAITQMIWLEKHNILITGSKDKRMKFWKMPVQWRDQEIEIQEEKEAFRQQEAYKIQKAQQQFKKQDQNSDDDDDDLTNWHKF